MDKLSLTVDWYNKKAKGLLFPITLPDILGGAIPPNVNVGVVQNKGFDILLGTKGRGLQIGMGCYSHHFQL